MTFPVSCIDCGKAAVQHLDPAKHGVFARCEACAGHGGPAAPTASYEQWLSTKAPRVPAHGIEPARELNPRLFPWQRDTVRWALARGRAALFEECGLGKSAQQLEWAAHVATHTGRPVLILAPLAVSSQTVREGRKFGIEVTYAPDASSMPRAGVAITNYERLDRFDGVELGGVVLDESSILKAYAGKTKRAILQRFAETPFRLACTATPAPNDHLELGNHAEFLGVLSSHEMIARWFINDSSTFGTYRLKGHAIVPFWDWVGSWARCVGLPSDLGAYSDDGYVLPELRLHKHVVDVDVTADRGDRLFRIPELSATSVHAEKRRSAPARARAVAELVAREPGEAWLVWCDTDYEADALVEAIGDGAVEVRGPMEASEKEDRLLAFCEGRARVLVTKPSIAGWGLNLQHCARVAFVGATFSFESYYQAIRRSWRFGQTRPVDAHVVMASTEFAVWDVLQQKARAHESMKAEMFAAMRRAQFKEDNRAAAYAPRERAALPAWLKGDAA